jgi:hypothetical protein
MIFGEGWVVVKEACERKEGGYSCFLTFASGKKNE